MASLIKNLKKTKSIFNVFFYKENKILSSSIHTNIIPSFYGMAIKWNKFLQFTFFNYFIDKDPGPTFISDTVQNHLKLLTRINIKKVYRKRKMEDKYLDTPQYKFMTTEQVEKLMNDMRLKAEEKLQMPPVVQVRSIIFSIIG